MTRRARLSVNVYEVVRRAVDSGARWGYTRAHKHTNKPSEEALIESITDHVMLQLDEVLFWE